MSPLLAHIPRTTGARNGFPAVISKIVAALFAGKCIQPERIRVESSALGSPLWIIVQSGSAIYF
jgi:hypothetical protein